MSLRQTLTDAMKDAMKAKDAKRLATVRMMLAALKDRDIAARSETSKELIGEDEILTLLAKMIKQREESATAFDASFMALVSWTRRDIDFSFFGVRGT